MAACITTLSLECIEDILRTRVSLDTLDMFVRTRISATEAAAAVASLARDVVRAFLTEARKHVSVVPSVLELRNCGDAAWEAVCKLEPACRAHAMDVRCVETAIRALPRDDAARREEALVTTVGAQAEHVASRVFTDVLQSSQGTRTRAAALRILVTMSSTTLAWAPGNCVSDRIARDTQRRATSALLCPSDVRAVERALQVGSITHALTFCILSLASPPLPDDKDRDNDKDVDSATASAFPVLLGVPAMLREARPHAFLQKDDALDGDTEKALKRTNPALTEPKPAGGGLPSPSSFLVCRGSSLEYNGKVLARCGGLLSVLPGWRGIRTDTAAFAHYMCVDPHTRVASVLRVTSSSSGAVREPDAARVLLRFVLSVDEEDPSKAIGWIDAQRDFEGNLVLAWGSFNPLTGGVARSYYMGLEEADEYARGADPFREVDKGDVDDMFAARFETAAAIDFRDHGSVLEASIANGETTVVYHDTVIKILRGVRLAAIWGTAHAFVGWIRDKDGAMYAGTWHGAQGADQVEETVVKSQLCKLPHVPMAAEHESVSLSIAPWW
jgi:hypothetical protein